MSECAACAMCAACKGECGVCPYADQTKHYHQRQPPQPAEPSRATVQKSLSVDDPVTLPCGAAVSPRRFLLVRETDISGVSGTGIVAEGIEFTSGVVALTWRSDWPTSVVFHDRGMASVEAVHGHGGATRIVWLDEPTKGQP